MTALSRVTLASAGLSCYWLGNNRSVLTSMQVRPRKVLGCPSSRVAILGVMVPNGQRLAAVGALKFGFGHCLAP